jgi:hypothetical protein
MDVGVDVPEITTGWDILRKSPADVMCATSRMVVKRKGADQRSWLAASTMAYPVVVSCTLLPYDAQFELGRTLRQANGTVPLNHPFCAQFCVLGGAHRDNF